MPINDILWLLKNYIILALKILTPILIIFLIGYFLVYKKILKGTKTIKKSQILLYSIFLCYVVVVIGATFLGRTPSESNNVKMNLNLFSSYVEAYHDIGVVLLNNVLLRNLILNIMLFIPLGFLLPMCSEKLKKMYIIVPIGLLATLTIEFTQHFNGYGIFEIDDAFNNTMGTLLGYCIFMIFYRLKNKENWKKIIGYTIPIITTIGVFVAMLIAHNTQEFGNFDFENNYTINMSKVDIKTETDFSKDKEKMLVYQTDIITRDKARDIAINIFNKKGKLIDDNVDRESENLVVFKPIRKDMNEEDASVVVYYVGGKYSYSDSSYIVIKNDGTVEPVSKIDNASEEDVKFALQKIGINVPENAKFGRDEKRDQYLFSVNMDKQENRLVNGEIRCNYYSDNSIKYFENNIVTYDIVTEKEIMSEQEAYQQILDGKFKGFTIDEIKSITVNGVELEYQTDSKGYYVPVYKFDVLLNGNKNTIYIKAIK